jgi:hypothetical protein
MFCLSFHNAVNDYIWFINDINDYNKLKNMAHSRSCPIESLMIDLFARHRISDAQQINDLVAYTHEVKAYCK